MELAELQAFVKVAQTGSFTRAAELLGTQKTHVSRVITKLEKKLGVRLLERSTRALHLTEVGREVFERAVGILAAVEDTERVTQQVHAEPRGVLRLTCGVELGMLAVSRWIKDYLRKYPQVGIEADYTNRLVDLVHEGSDLAVRVGELDDSRLAARKLGELRYGLFASPDYLSRRGQPMSPDDLGGHDLLIFSVGSHASEWRLTHNEEEERRVELTGRLHVNNSFAVCDAALAGLGIAKLPLIVAAEPLADGRLAQVLPDWLPSSVPVHEVFPSSRYLTPKLRAFVDHARETFPGSLTSGRAGG